MVQTFTGGYFMEMVTENVFEGTATKSTRLTNLKFSFSTRVTDLKTDSGSIFNSCHKSKNR